MTLVQKIFNCFKDSDSFSLQEAYRQNADKPQETVRARIYEKIGVKFERVAKGVYRTIDCEEEQCVLIEGNGRDLSMLKDNSIDCILTDHPWLDTKSNKGKARSMRIDKKKSDITGKIQYMSGCKGMLPAMFDVQPVSRRDRIHQSELPVELCEQILEYVTYEGEIVLDSFAGSGAVGVAALNKKRSCILIELLRENIEKIRARFNNVLYKTVLE